MYTHEPEAYRCPLCAVAQGIEEDGFPYTRQADVVYRDDTVTAFIASHWWPKNKGHVLIVPNRHIESLYDMPDDLLAAVHSFSRTVALALKETHGCDGVSVRQHNEPAGDQDVWHYHLHVFPRYEGDQLYMSNDQKAMSTPEERIWYTGKLKSYFAKV